jgi:hypothetical protein
MSVASIISETSSTDNRQAREVKMQCAVSPPMFLKPQRGAVLHRGPKPVARHLRHLKRCLPPIQERDPVCAWLQNVRKLHELRSDQSRWKVTTRLEILPRTETPAGTNLESDRRVCADHSVDGCMDSAFLSFKEFALCRAIAVGASLCQVEIVCAKERVRAQVIQCR